LRGGGKGGLLPFWAKKWKEPQEMER